MEHTLAKNLPELVIIKPIVSHRIYPLRLLRAVAAPLLITFSAGCSTVGYYAQAVRGHLDLTMRKENIEELIADPATEDALRARLRAISSMREFAHGQLALPASGSYSDYADLQREAAVWLVTAAPRYDLSPHRWCYPFIGCLAYRGFFDRDDAVALAARLKTQGLETHVGPALAYSTLGWMDDPVLNTMLVYSDLELAGIIFHELAHEAVFVAGDEQFNESYASVVERHGRAAYATTHEMTAELAAIEAAELRHREFTTLLLAHRERLHQLFTLRPQPTDIEARKQQLIDQLVAEYHAIRNDAWDGISGFDHWFVPDPPNNARLALLTTYEGLTAEFDALFRSLDGFRAFHDQVRQLGRLDYDQRRRELAARAQLAQTEVESPVERQEEDDDVQRVAEESNQDAQFQDQ